MDKMRVVCGSDCMDNSLQNIPNDAESPWKPDIDEVIGNGSDDNEVANSPQFVSSGRGSGRCNRKMSIKDLKLPCAAKHLLLDDAHYVKSSEKEMSQSCDPMLGRSAKIGKSIGRGRAVYEQMKRQQVNTKPKKMSPFAHLPAKEVPADELNKQKTKNGLLKWPEKFLLDVEKHKDLLKFHPKLSIDRTARVRRRCAEPRANEKATEDDVSKNCLFSSSQLLEDQISITKFERTVRRSGICLSPASALEKTKSSEIPPCCQRHKKVFDEICHRESGDMNNNHQIMPTAETKYNHSSSQLMTEAIFRDHLRERGPSGNNSTSGNVIAPQELSFRSCDVSASGLGVEGTEEREKSGVELQTKAGDGEQDARVSAPVSDANPITVRARKVNKDAYGSAGESSNLSTKEVCAYFQSFREIVSSQGNPTNHLQKDKILQDLHQTVARIREPSVVPDPEKVREKEDEKVWFTDENMEPYADDWDTALDDLLVDGPCTLEIYNLPTNVKMSNVFEYLEAFDDVLACHIDRNPDSRDYVGAVARIRMTSSKSSEWLISCLHGSESPFPGTYPEDQVPLLVCSKCL